MGKRRGRKEAAKEPQIPAADEDEEEEEQEEKGSGFFACYLLTSLCPRFKGHTYIGYTVNPRRRIRQHNGEIGSGAFRTKRKRPWEMVLCIYGFPTNVAALQFEWAWQHPVESLAVRKAAASFKSLSGLANKIKLAYTMLTLPPWQSLNLTVNLFSTKYRHHTSACPALPEQMRTQVCSMDDLPCYNADSCISDELDDIEIECSFQKSTDKESRGVVEEEEEEEEDYFHNYDHISGENMHRRDSANLESSGYLARTWVGSQSYSSPIRREDQGRSSIDKDSSSRLVEESWSDELLNKLPATAMDADESVPMTKSPDVSSRQVEIIDIFTPSPCYMEKPGSKKKRRRPNMCPEVIDLTNSPIFV